MNPLYRSLWSLAKVAGEAIFTVLCIALCFVALGDWLEGLMR